MLYEYDEPTSDMEVMMGAYLHLKSGYVDSYDPVITLEITSTQVKINNACYDYVIELSDVLKIEMCKRNPQYDEDIDILEYIDSDIVTIWENTNV
ncbi:MAG: hypothetical protein RR959_08825 [Erysipelotrichaceae bacterium]